MGGSLGKCPKTPLCEQTDPTASVAVDKRYRLTWQKRPDRQMSHALIFLFGVVHNASYAISVLNVPTILP